jgi:hypothetical protein
MKPGNVPLKSIRLLDQVREHIRYLHYSLSTEKVYLYWVKFFVRWHGRNGVMRHPREMGEGEVEAFLTMLATERKVSASTHNQALSAIRLRAAMDRTYAFFTACPPNPARICASSFAA